MTDRDYAIKSMKEITFQMANHAQNYLEVTIERHYTDIKELMTSYQKLILENQVVLEELDMECQEKINEDMAYKEPVSEIEKKYQELLKTLSQEQEEVITEYCNAIFSSGAETEEFFYRLRLKDGLNLKNTVKFVLEMIS